MVAGKVLHIRLKWYKIIIRLIFGGTWRDNERSIWKNNKLYADIRY